MLGARIKVVGINEEKVANNLLWRFQDAFKREEQQMEFKDERRWKIGKDGRSGYKWN